jgi:hypothetical protein
MVQEGVRQFSGFGFNFLANWQKIASRPFLLAAPGGGTLDVR